MSVFSLQYSDEVIAHLSLSLTDEVAVSVKVCIESVEYRQGHFVLCTQILNLVYQSLGR